MSLELKKIRMQLWLYLFFCTISLLSMSITILFNNCAGESTYMANCHLANRLCFILEVHYLVPSYYLSPILRLHATQHSYSVITTRDWRRRLWCRFLFYFSLSALLCFHFGYITKKLICYSSHRISCSLWLIFKAL